ncbi:MAG: VOC family protein [bacterium]
MVSITPHLWYIDKAVEAAKFYASVIPNSHVDSVMDLPTDSPSGPAGSVQIVDFTLAGQPFQAINAGPLDDFNHSISFVLECDTQAEIDRFWEVLGDGGEYEGCGWLRDRYGLSWQIVPKKLSEMMKGTDVARSKRVADVMLSMEKLEIAPLESAYRGEMADSRK